jgi:hypothetical protein
VTTLRAAGFGLRVWRRRHEMLGGAAPWHGLTDEWRAEVAKASVSLLLPGECDSAEFTSTHCRIAWKRKQGPAALGGQISRSLGSRDADHAARDDARRRHAVKELRWRTCGADKMADTMDQQPSAPFFVWRVATAESDAIQTPWAVDAFESVRIQHARRACRYCGELLLETSTGDPADELHYDMHTGTGCGFCGWGEQRVAWEDAYDEGSSRGVNVLHEVEPGTAEATFRELGAAIAARPARALDLTPRRFEELVAAVFADAGYSVELTSTSKDGGRDLVVMQNVSSEHAIVEVKRYRRPVGVELVRQLRGVQLGEGVPHAMLVTSSSFTSGARAAAHLPIPEQFGFRLELFKIDELLSTLGVLDEPLQSPAAMGRERAAYRAWLLATFGVNTPVPVGPRRRQIDWRRYDAEKRR